MRSTFLKDPRDLQETQLERYNRVKELAKKMSGVMKHIAATSRFTAAPPSAYPPLRSPIPEYTVTEQILPLSLNKKIKRKNENFLVKKNQKNSSVTVRVQNGTSSPFMQHQMPSSQFESTLQISTEDKNINDAKWQKTNTTQFGKVEEYVTNDDIINNNQ